MSTPRTLNDQTGTKQDTYEHQERCVNCREVNRFDIPRGTTIRLFMLRRKCKNCGCSIN